MAEKAAPYPTGQPVPPPYTQQGGPPVFPGQPPAAPAYQPPDGTVYPPTNYPPQQPGTYYPPQQPGTFVQQPPGYQCLPGQPGVPVVGTTILVTTGPQNSRAPTNCICPKCQQNIVTQVSYETGSAAWILFGIICLLGGWVFCLCLIPFCINDLKDVHHTCPNCKHLIAICKRS